MPMISVIIPVYQATAFIPICVASLQAQEFRDFELIFVDDGSKDQSLEILQYISMPDVPIHIVTQENQGQGSARNHGITLSTGEFLCFVDIDDYIEPSMLKKLYEKQQSTGADIVWCNAYKVINGTVGGTLDEGMMYSENPVEAYLLNNAGPWRKLIRSSLIKEHDAYFPSIRFYEDVAIVPAYARYAKHIAYLEEPLYDYVMHEGSTMHQKKYDKRLEDIFEALTYLRKQLGSQMLSEYHEAMEFLHIDHLLHAASLRFFAFPQGKAALQRVCDVMKQEYPNWNHNAYYRQKDWKYRLVCRLFYQKRYWILKRIIG